MLSFSFPIVSNLIKMCLDVVIFMFLAGFHWASCNCGFIIFIKSGKILAMMSSNIFLCPALSFPLKTPVTLGMSHPSHPRGPLGGVLQLIGAVRIFSNLLLIQSSIFFISDIVVFTSRSSIWIFSMASMPLFF